MTQTRRTAQPAQIVPSGREIVTGPATRWLAPETSNIDFPIAHLAGNDTGAPLAQIDPAILGAVGGSEEYSTPVSRARGQLLRTIPFAVVWLVLGVGVVWLLGMEWPWLLVWWGLLTVVTFWRLNRDEFEFSRNGLERHRVDSAVDVQLDAAAKAHELKKMALESYLAIARAQYLGRADNDTTIE